jgi:ketol-acid reductoisomerase
MMAPKSPGDIERIAYLEGFGVPALISVHKDFTGNAKKIALALAKGIGSTRAGVFETSFDFETKTDLFGEQAVLCGGVTAMIKAGYETLREGGYPAEIAYFEVLHEVKLITDLIHTGGLSKMWYVVSNTAEYGGLTRRDRVITKESKEGMRSILADIESGRFKDEWRAEWRNGLKEMKRMESEDAASEIETVGKEIRSLFERKK